MRPRLFWWLVSSGLATVGVGCETLCSRLCPSDSQTYTLPPGYTAPVIPGPTGSRTLPPPTSGLASPAPDYAVRRTTGETLRPYEPGQVQRTAQYPPSTPGYEPNQLRTRSSSTPSRSPISTNQTWGHAPDYSWVQGQLEYSGIRGGMWKVRYVPLDVDDPYGGSFILQADPTGHGLRHGDTVYVEGRIVQHERHRGLPNPAYHVQNIRRVDRSADW